MQLLYKYKCPLGQFSLKIGYLTCICHTASFLSKFLSNSITNDIGLHVHNLHKIQKTLQYQSKHKL